MSAASDFDRMIMDFMNDDPMIAYYIKTVEGEYDPATGEANTVVTEIPVRAILLDVDRSANGLSTKYGTEIISGDKELYCLPPKKLDPTAQPLDVNTAVDFIRVGSVTYKIHVMKEANHNATEPLLYSFVLRR